MTPAAHAAVAVVLANYLDGLYDSDTSRLGEVLHPAARYVTVSDGTLVDLSVDEYLPIVDARPAPSSLDAERRDRIVSIEFAGPSTAVAIVECIVAPRSFVDILTLVELDGRWQIIAKVFHYEAVA